MKNILIIGSDGFIGFNLVKKISTDKNFNVTEINRINIDHIICLNKTYDVVIYAAGVNRGTDDEIKSGNEILLTKIIKKIKFKEIIFLSTALIDRDENNHKAYIESKRECEKLLGDLSCKQVDILRLPNVFGIWSKPNYNSFLHTLVYKVVNNEKYEIDDKNKILDLLYIDDLSDLIIKKLHSEKIEKTFESTPITLGDLEIKIKEIKIGLENNDFTFIKTKFDYQLYVTYLYHSNVIKNQCKSSFMDERGEFIELMKINSTQVSMIVCKPGYSRGNHYHHNKVEHFLVLDGNMKFVESDIKNGTEDTTIIFGGKREWITTRPGINHTIYNIGESDLKILCISHDIFDKRMPDTYTL